MSYAPRLLSALIALDGEALVLHSGDLPYVATARGPVDLGSRPLTRDALGALITELLPRASQDELTVQGSTAWRAPLSPRYPGQRFTIVSAFVNDELWLEVRREAVAAPVNAAPAEVPQAAPAPPAPTRSETRPQPSRAASARPDRPRAEPARPARPDAPGLDQYAPDEPRPDRRRRERRMKQQSGPEDLHVPTADELWRGDDSF